MKPTNPIINNRVFLKDLISDDYFPSGMMKKGQQILSELCYQIEQQKPSDADVLKLTHLATERFNELEEEFEGDIETIAREAIADDFAFILTTYGYAIDIEEAIAPREW